jgi:hypothetical protein
VWAHFGTALDPRTVVHAWLSRAALVNATSLGYRAIWSVDGQYYLDALGEVWESFYNVGTLKGVGSAVGGGGAVAAAVRELLPRLGLRLDVPADCFACADILEGITNSSAIPLVLGGEGTLVLRCVGVRVRVRRAVCLKAGAVLVPCRGQGAFPWHASLCCFFFYLLHCCSCCSVPGAWWWNCGPSHGDAVATQRRTGVRCMCRLHGVAPCPARSHPTPHPPPPPAPITCNS